MSRGGIVKRRGTIATIFDPSNNSLNAIRLALALAVIVSHSWALGGFGPEPSAGGATLGTWAVLGFFGISGFLITRSRLSGQSALNYYRGRALRIFPGFIVCLVLIAAVFAPLSLVFDHSGYWAPADSIAYFVHNLLLYPPSFGHDAIGGTLQGVPYRGVWDGSLWTLFWEAACYLALGIAGSLLSRRLLKAAVAVVFVLALILALVNELGLVQYPGVLGRVLPLFAIFAAGSATFLFAERIRVNTITVTVAVVVLALSIALGLVQSLGTLPLIFLIMLLGYSLHVPFIGRRRDISYGVYIYAWPVQQYVFLVFGNGVSLAVEVTVSVLVTAGLAYLSCRFIEQPALRLKRSPIRVSAASQ